MIFSSMDGGADRLEVCASLKLGGGTTPSIGLVLRITKECAKRKGQPIEIVVRRLRAHCKNEFKGLSTNNNNA